MIEVQRGQPPNILQRLGQTWLNDLLAATTELNQLENDPAATPQQIRKAKQQKKQAQKKYAHPEVKKALVDMFHEKCAYCESQIRVVAYGHIEHFLPKAAYINYTFEWSNLVLSCAICNNTAHKGVKFPVDANGDPLLLDPTEPNLDIEAHLKLHWNPTSRLASIYWLDDRGRETVATFDLNGIRGRPALIKARSRYVRKLLNILEHARQGNAEALSILQDSLLPDAPYLAFARKYIAPELAALANP